MLFPIKKQKTLLFLVIFLIAGATASNIRLLSDKDPFCNEYGADGSCCKCAYRFYWNKDTKLCTQVSDFCATWDNKTGCCLTCYPSYGSPVNGVCSSTPVNEGNTGNCDCDCNCQAFNNHRECVKCYKGYEFNAHNVCVACVTTVPPIAEKPTHKPVLITYCAKYSYSDLSGKIYNKWFDGCKSVCIECVKGYYLNKGICVVLPANCLAVDIKGRCTDCCEGYEVTNGVCVPIVVTPPQDNCEEYGYLDVKGKWFSKWIAGCKKVCKKCVNGYYLTCDFECLALPRHCAVADMYGRCTECQKGYELNKVGKCVKTVVLTPPVVNVDNCAVYGYVDDKGKYWTKWIAGCRKVCKECKQGFELVDGKCLPCGDDSVGNDNPYCVERNEHGLCCKCAYRTFMDRNGICVPVSDYCESWNQKTGACTCCYVGYTLVKGQCVLAH